VGDCMWCMLQISRGGLYRRQRTGNSTKKMQSRRERSVVFVENKKHLKNGDAMMREFGKE
jgi:hypothetical protein